MKPVRHTFVSAKADGADATVVQPSDWNDTHDWMEVVHKTADESFSLTTFSNSGDMSFALAASEICIIEYVIYFTTNIDTVGIRLAVNQTTAPSYIRAGLHLPTGAPANDATMSNAVATAKDTQPFAVTTGPGAVSAMAMLNVYLVNHGAADTIWLRHASETATATTIQRGTWARKTRIA